MRLVEHRASTFTVHSRGVVTMLEKHLTTSGHPYQIKSRVNVLFHEPDMQFGC
uniref:Uncharacterized protein n=1 Tax=Physcomitrium patens TaxID=3218 RepID=A0A2K1L8F0_PHYPA|nr:hypothetical protein PHYPA_000695 [Physcomitrium patens]